MRRLILPLLAALLLAAHCAIVSARPAGRRAAVPLGPLSSFSSKEEAQRAFRTIENKLKSRSEPDLKPLFERWKAQYGIKYSAGEEPARYANFVQTLRTVVSTNNDPAATYWLSLNRYSAMSFEEFKQKMLRPMKSFGPGLNSGNATRSHTRAGVRAIPPAAKDWRAEGKVSPIRNQGNCGSCVTFAVHGTIESIALIQSGCTTSDWAVDLSEQQLVDCTTGNYGCNGGWYTQSYTYAQGNYLTTEARYPYKAVNQACNNLGTVAGDFKISGFTQVAGTEAEFREVVGTLQPMAFAFQVINGFNSVNGGVYSLPAGTKCTDAYSTDPNGINHALVIVGYGTTSAGVPYWLVRNSWGTGWGEGGYIKIQRDASGPGVCNMYLYGGFYPNSISPLPKTCGAKTCPTCSECTKCDTTTGTCTLYDSSTVTCSTGKCNGAGQCIQVTCPATCPDCTKCDPATGTCSLFSNSTTSCNNGAGTCNGSGTCVPTSTCSPACGECTACDTTTTTCSLFQPSGTSCKGGLGKCSGQGVCLLNCPACSECSLCNTATGTCSLYKNNTNTCQNGLGKCNGAGKCELTCPTCSECMGCNTATGTCSTYKDSTTICNGGLGTCNGKGQCMVTCAKGCPECTSCNTKTGQCTLYNKNGLKCASGAGVCNGLGQCMRTCPVCSECTSCDGLTGTCTINKVKGTKCNKNKGACDGAGQCVTAPTVGCSGYCGKQNFLEKCWCDSLCSRYNDCCANKLSVCK